MDVELALLNIQQVFYHHHHHRFIRLLVPSRDFEMT